MIEPISRERLRAADPARNAHGEPERVEALLQRILAEPAAPQRTRRRRLLLVPVAAAVATVLALLFAVGDDRGRGPGGIVPALVQRAYAATTAGDAILHEVVRTVQSSDDGGEPTTVVIEVWSRPSDGSVLERIGNVDDPAAGGETLVDADGRLLVRSPAGRGQWTDLTADEGRAGRLYRSEVRRLRGLSAAGAFREAYERSDLRPAGTATFAGREAERFRAPARARQDEDTMWFIEKGTARLLGSRARHSVTVMGRKVTITDTVVLERYERLPPTAEHLDLLRGR
jgi:hypothetical protein